MRARLLPANHGQMRLAFGLAALIVAALILPESADPTAARVDTRYAP